MEMEKKTRKRMGVVMVIITEELTTVKAFAPDGRSFAEEFGRLPGGEPDYRKGNFEDEPDLDEGLMEALCCLQGPALAVMEQLNELKGDGK